MPEAGTGGVLCKKVFFKIWKTENLIARAGWRKFYLIN